MNYSRTYIHVPWRVSARWCAAGRTRWYAAGRARLIVIMRIIINRHSAILLRFQFIVFRCVDFDFLRLINQKPEIVPELVFMTYTLRHNMTQLMQCNECQCVFIDEFIPLLRCIHTECEFLALVLAIRGILAGRQCFTYFFRTEIFD